MARAVATKKVTELTLVNTQILFEDEGSGAEGIQQDDLMIPRIKLLQTGSPEAEKRNGAYVKGAEAGSVFNTVTKAVVDGEKGITVVPIKYRRAYIEWKANRGGFVRDHGSDPVCLEDCELNQETFRHDTKDGNEIVTTGEYFVLLIDKDGSYGPAILSMDGSQLKKARRWNSMMNHLKLRRPDDSGMFTPAMYYTAYNLTTVPTENDKGTWFVWDIEMLYGDTGGIISNLKNGEEIYMAARSFKEQVTSGDIRVAPETSTNEAF